MITAANRSCVLRAIILLACLLLLLPQVPILSCYAAAAEPKLKIGILAFEHKEEVMSKWEPLSTYLSEAIKGYQFAIVPLFYAEMDEAVSKGNVDFVFTNPGHYIALRSKNNLSGAIATVMEKVGDEAHYAFGGVVFTSAENRDIKYLRDLRGKTIAAVGMDSLGGFQAQAYELSRLGIDVERHLSLALTGMPHSLAVMKVIEGEADAGFVRTGVLENMIKRGELQATDIRIINPQKVPGFGQSLSTVLYPEWPFSALNHVSNDMARALAAALLMLRPDAPEATAIGIYGFNIPSSYLGVEAMMRELKLYPFDQADGFSLGELWRRYYFVIVFLLLILLGSIGLALYKTRSGSVAKERNRELQVVMDRLNVAYQELEDTSLKDGLTGLFNRRYLDLAFPDKVEMAVGSGTSISLLIVDMDSFKDINDKFGHPAGDQALVSVGQIISQALYRATDFVARYGGDEFVVVLYDTAEDGALLVANRIMASISDAELAGTLLCDHPLSVSIGGSVAAPKGGCLTADLLRHADEAMYSVKRQGGGGVKIVTACA